MTRLGATLAAAFAEVLQRSTRSRMYGLLTHDLDAAIDAATYPVISALDRVGSRSAAELAADVGLDRSVVSRHADRLEVAGLLRREPDPRDGRTTLLTLTERGAQQVGVMRERLDDAFDDYLATLPRDEARAFVDGFVRFVRDGPFGSR
ncbi:MarR family winged helix-turn-helix transcriptional regulator [Mycolicibacterium sediminis]|uniref:HTH marR-type domain-containing protein n=1 Tax=Mycolicibacterium sediminis TaxID=1286180 RepID=A0A7I7QUX4_9MYCO|nr:MarR family transcriptional regulator [Mycolicibacterium sediminis]BBY29696.1 hypothetical protein MSEDJ_37920 [Mycolicibacterium sediminis]